MLLLLCVKVIPKSCIFLYIYLKQFYSWKIESNGSFLNSTCVDFFSLVLSHIEPVIYKIIKKSLLLAASDQSNSFAALSIIHDLGLGRWPPLCCSLFSPCRSWSSLSSSPALDNPAHIPFFRFCQVFLPWTIKKE